MVHSIFVVRSQQISCDTRNFVCREENWQKNIVSSFSVIKLFFAINKFNNKTVILLNLAEYLLILANSAMYQAMFRSISQDNY